MFYAHGAIHAAVTDAPLALGIGLALVYQRVNLDGDLGHFIGVEVSVLGGGSFTSSRKY